MKRFLLMIPMVLLLLTACGSKQAPSAEIPGDGVLEIPVSELSEKIQIYSFTLDGLNMEALAAKDADGTVRTAFNTCQVCNGSRKAYFAEEGDHVVCQNCGNSFGRSDVQGGCRRPLRRLQPLSHLPGRPGGYRGYGDNILRLPEIRRGTVYPVEGEQPY